jgi:hypothetical protein
MWISEQLAIKKMFHRHSPFNRGKECPFMASSFQIFSACKKKNGHHPGGDDARIEEKQLCLRQVIAERRQEHVLVGIGRTTHTLPSIPSNVGVLRSELDSAAIPVIYLVPESARALE